MTPRFTPPTANPPWSGILQAISYGPACPQQWPPGLDNVTESLGRMTRQYWTHLTRLRDSITHQAEDCLYLNIFRLWRDMGSVEITFNPRPHNGRNDSHRSSNKNSGQDDKSRFLNFIYFYF